MARKGYHMEISDLGNPYWVDDETGEREPSRPCWEKDPRPEKKEPHLPGFEPEPRASGGELLIYLLLGIPGLMILYFFFHAVVVAAN